MKKVTLFFWLFCATNLFSQQANVINILKDVPETKIASQIDEKSSESSENSGKMIFFGFNLSPSISWLNSGNQLLTTEGSIMAGQAGFNAEYKLKNYLSIITGVNFSVSGGYLFDSLSVLSADSKYNFKLNNYSLQIPVALRYNSKEINSSLYYVQGGIVPGFRLASTEFHTPKPPYDEFKSFNISSITNALMVQYMLGIGTRIITDKKYDFFGEINFNGSLNSLLADGYVPVNESFIPAGINPVGKGEMVFSFGIMFK